MVHHNQICGNIYGRVKEIEHLSRRESADLWRHTSILLKLFVCQSLISTLDSCVFDQADVRY